MAFLHRERLLGFYPVSCLNNLNSKYYDDSRQIRLVIRIQGSSEVSTQTIGPEAVYTPVNEPGASSAGVSKGLRPDFKVIQPETTYTGSPISPYTRASRVNFSTRYRLRSWRALTCPAAVPCAALGAA